MFIRKCSYIGVQIGKLAWTSYLYFWPKSGEHNTLTSLTADLSEPWKIPSVRVREIDENWVVQSLVAIPCCISYLREQIWGGPFRHPPPPQIRARVKEGCLVSRNCSYIEVKYLWLEYHEICTILIQNTGHTNLKSFTFPCIISLLCAAAQLFDIRQVERCCTLPVVLAYLSWARCGVASEWCKFGSNSFKMSSFTGKFGTQGSSAPAHIS